MNTSPGKAGGFGPQTDSALPHASESVAGVFGRRTIHVLRRDDDEVRIMADFDDDEAAVYVWLARGIHGGEWYSYGVAVGGGRRLDPLGALHIYCKGWRGLPWSEWEWREGARIVATDRRVTYYEWQSPASGAASSPDPATAQVRGIRGSSTEDENR